MNDQNKKVHFENAQDFLHQFLMDGGQIELFKTRKTEVLPPKNWDQSYDAAMERFMDDAIKLASDDVIYPAHRLNVASEKYGISEYALRKAIKEQRLGAVRKYKRWYPYRPALQKLQMELLKKARPEMFPDFQETSSEEE